MEVLNIIFQSISCLLALLAAAILLWVNKDKSHSNRMLAWVLVTLAVTLLNSLLFYTGFYLKFPALFKIGLPFSLLIVPASYIYIRSVLLGELKFRKSDAWLLLPAILYAVNLLPFYMMPDEEKKAILLKFYSDPSVRTRFNEGVLPVYMFSFIRVGWSILLIVLSFRLINRFKKQMPKQVVLDNKELIKWLTNLNWLFIGVLVVAFVVAISSPFVKTDFMLVDLAMGFIAIVICVQLFMRPKLLYGVFQPISNAILSSDPVVRQEIEIPHPNPEEKQLTDIEELPTANNLPVPDITISLSDSVRFKKIVETLFLQQKPYLKTEYSLEQLVIDTGIPRYVLSAFINREYGMGFREFLNRYRVDFFKDNLELPEWKNLTLEAIASECGFNSRSTFIKNFKEITGQTPSEYVKFSQKPPMAKTG